MARIKWTEVDVIREFEKAWNPQQAKGQAPANIPELTEAIGRMVGKKQEIKP